MTGALKRFHSHASKVTKAVKTLIADASTAELLRRRVGIQKTPSLLDPRRRRRVGRLDLDRKLLHGALQGRLVAGEVGRHRVVEQQQLLVHHFHLES